MLLLIKLNPLLYYERYSNFNDMILLNNKPLYSYTWLDNNLYLLHLIQQQIYLYNDTWYSNLYMMILDTAISSINLQQWFSKLYYALMILLIQNINNLSSTTNLWHGTLNIIHEQGDRLPAAGGPPTDAHTRSGSEDATPLSKTMNFVLLYCFFLFCHLCYSISTIRRPISREDAHRMYPRYPRVFLYVIIYCPLPHQSLWERLGVSL
jgi:hypothetical protein